ncbi:MAG: hypothetical protein JF887_05750 [Candidatus Dormibacteraeota bacterium]|uniref:Sodium/calcium exchanger membrane region domain-containing protein n=1 Tax=Candidatus Amunia macphersoniae TaxID=3127014 RepID=A0A934NJ51_9BACT|nr:hypothetical protein [Candidatus Dormibacteraeota bacterium]
MSAVASVAAFLVGVILVVIATERLLDGLVGAARLLRVAPFVASALLSGLEAENVAVGLAAGSRGDAEIALGTAFGGAIFLVCFALGIGALIAPLRVSLPQGIPRLLAAMPLLAGVSLIGGSTSRLAGLALLVGFALAMTYLVRAARGHRFLETEGVDDATRPTWMIVLFTVGGITVVTIGGELVASGAAGVIATFGVPALLMGMVVTPAAIEAEEVIRQVIPTRRGHPDVAAGNAVGTVVYFLLFNLGLIALLTPVPVPRLTRLLDWPALVVACAVAATFLARGRLGRVEGGVLVGLGVGYVIAHLMLR